MELKKGTSLLDGKYRIERTLGQGSFGITYLAKTKFTAEGALGSMTIEAQVAIKEFFMSDVNSRCNGGTAVEGSTGSVFTNYRKKFKKEAQNLASLSHPNIVKVLDVFDENNTTYYVMEFIEGENLDDYIKRNGHLSEKEAIVITKEIGSALSYMHSRNMLHLDIKPKNIMRKADGVCRLIDFGLSKQFNGNGEPESNTTIGLGTPGYAPIEQASYKQSGTFPATLDVYALGATVYKMLTGKRPPEAATIIEDGFPRKELVTLGISKRMISATEKAMAPSRKSRYQTTADFLAALPDNEETTTIATPEVETTTIDATIDKEEIDMASIWESHSEPIQKPEPEPTLIYDSESESSSRKWWFVGGAVALLAIVLMVWQPWQPEPKPAGAITENPTESKTEAKSVTSMFYHSTNGDCSYTGEVDDQNLPHGKGVATWNTGSGLKYDGEWVHGAMEGDAKYYLRNGDTFVGTYKGNKFHEGVYTIKSTGEYFKGTYQNSKPAKGAWYDKADTLIETI